LYALVTTAEQKKNFFWGVIKIALFELPAAE
jgi:hypothetical protein